MKAGALLVLGIAVIGGSVTAYEIYEHTKKGPSGPTIMAINLPSSQATWDAIIESSPFPSSGPMAASQIWHAPSVPAGGALLNIQIVDTSFGTYTANYDNLGPVLNGAKYVFDVSAQTLTQE